MPNCQDLWEAVDLAAQAVDLSSAAVDALRPAWDAANAALQADSQNLIDAIEAAMACETGENRSIPLQQFRRALRSLKSVRLVHPR